MSGATPARPRRGDFGWQALVSAFEPTLEDLMSDRAFFGMLPEALYLRGTSHPTNRLPDMGRRIRVDLRKY